MSKPAEPIERPGMGGYFAYLNPPAAPVGDEQQDIEQDEGGEQSSTAEAGTDSSTSSSSTAVSTERGQTNRPKPARGAARRS